MLAASEFYSVVGVKGKPRPRGVRHHGHVIHSRDRRRYRERVPERLTLINRSFLSSYPTSLSVLYPLTFYYLTMNTVFAPQDKPNDPKMIGRWKVGRTIGRGCSGRPCSCICSSPSLLIITTVRPRSNCSTLQNGPTRCHQNYFQDLLDRIPCLP